MPTVQYLLRERERFRGRDPGMVRAITADLARLGHHDTVPEPTRLETTDLGLEFERAVPRRGGRPKLPRCEHGHIVGRCMECEED